MKQFLIIILFIFAHITTQAQQPDKLKALNKYINFTNESTHGLLIIHRLLENFNQEVNKYVDLPNYTINNISNRDLPLNIFEDSDHWFYNTTPHEWFKQLKEEKYIVGEKAYNSLFPIAKNLFNVSNNINAKRFEIADFISKANFKEKDDLKKIYSLLEEAVDLFDLFFAYELNLEHQLTKIYTNKSSVDIKELLKLYDKSKELLLSIRNKKSKNFKNKINSLSTQLDKLISKNKKNEDAKVTGLKKRIAHSVADIIKISKEYNNSPNISKEYVLYGKYYYYYNIAIIDKFNRYGNGFVRFINKIIEIKKSKTLFCLEYPHYFKVIYPNRIPEKIKTIKSSNPNVITIPNSLKNRKIINNNNQKIIVDTTEIVLELYDHKIQDGDIISINFNGDWIYNNISLETKPKIFKLSLNKKGKNYIILHAENEGRRPPNTIGINYTSEGKKKTIVLSSDLKSSEMIEIIIKDNI